MMSFLYFKTLHICFIFYVSFLSINKYISQCTSCYTATNLVVNIFSFVLRIDINNSIIKTSVPDPFNENSYISFNMT